MTRLGYLLPFFLSWFVVMGGVAQAGSNEADRPHGELGGLYGGVGLSLFGSYTATLTPVGELGDALEEQDASITVDVGQTQTDWLKSAGVFFGYGQHVGTFYLGGEVSYSSGFGVGEVIEAEVSGESGTANLNSGEGYALSGRAGYVVSPSTMLYGKVSYQIRNFEVEVDSESDDDDFSGFGFGIGAEHQFSELPFAVRVEAMRVDYGAENISGEGEGFEVSFDVEPIETAVDLQALYRF